MLDSTKAKTSEGDATGAGATPVFVAVDGLTRSISMYTDEAGWAWGFAKDAAGTALAFPKPIPTGGYVSISVAGWDDTPGIWVTGPGASTALKLVASRLGSR